MHRITPFENKNFVNEIISKDGPLPLDAISLGVRVTLQTSFLPHIILEDVPMDRTYEEQVSFMDVSGRIPFERVFQVDDDWVYFLHRGY